MLNRNDLGKDGFVWWFGPVEDIMDPLDNGRIRVRPVGFYPDSVPVSDLPWAQCIEPIYSAANKGIGISPTGIQVGSWVVGFFLDGKEGQRPMVLGTFSGIQDDEPDVSALARGENPSNPSDKDSNRTTGVSTPTGSWDEPASAYAAEYPYNSVRTTKSGHIKEYDDTPGSERIHEYHKAGTFYEIDASGNRVVRVVGDDYEVVHKGKNVYVTGVCNLTVDNNCNTKIKGDWNIDVGGDKIENITGSLKQTVKQSVEENYQTSLTQMVSGMVTETHGSLMSTSEGTMTLIATRINLNP